MGLTGGPRSSGHAVGLRHALYSLHENCAPMVPCRGGRNADRMRTEGSSHASGHTQTQEGSAEPTRTDHAIAACAFTAPNSAGHTFGHTGSHYRTDDSQPLSAGKLI